jgi:hypothetical protein
VRWTSIPTQAGPSASHRAAAAEGHDFALLEDFDHLYRYANLYELVEGKKAEAVTSTLTEIMPGRPGSMQHRDPHDNVRKHYDRHPQLPNADGLLKWSTGGSCRHDSTRRARA